MKTWTRSWSITGPEPQWIGLLALWGDGLQYLSNMSPTVLTSEQQLVTVTAGNYGKGTLLMGTLVLALWVIPRVPLVLAPETTRPVLGETVWHHRPGQKATLAAILSQDRQVACVQPEGCELSLAVPHLLFPTDPGNPG